MKKRITYFPKHTASAPSSRYRSYQYAKYFEEEGYELIFHPLYPDSYVIHLYSKGKRPLFTVAWSYIKRFFQLLFLRRYDIIYIQQELFPFIPFWVEKWLLKNKKNIILDYDDAAFHHYDKSNNSIIKKILHDKIYRLVQLADHVITGSPYLTEVLSAYTKNITEIPTSIDFEKYENAVVAENKNDDAFVIGWIGSKTTSKNMLDIKDAFIQLQQKGKFCLALIGFDKFQEDELNGINHILYKWDEATEVSLLKSFDAGIMPLTNTPFNNGKCGFKLVQYMASGLPTISTPLAANVKINRSGENKHATTVEEWVFAIESMAVQKEHYKNVVGKKNIEIAKEYYSIQSNYKKYLQLFSMLINKKNN